MFRGRNLPPNENRERENTMGAKKGIMTEKFRASVSKNITLSIMNKDNGIYIIVKKELPDLKADINTSEAPVLNSFLKIPEPFEFIQIDKDIIIKEIEPINTALKIAYGTIRDFQIETVAFIIGSGDDDFATIDQNDLEKYNVIPTISGVVDFFQLNKESIIGIANSRFEPEKGNIILFEALCKEPELDVHSIQIKVLSSVQQRGISMQKKQSLGGVDLYLTIKAKFLSDQLLDFLRELDIDVEMIQLRRELAINNWIELEAERSATNLKAYLAKKYSELNHFEISTLVSVCVENQLNFKIAEKITELLSNLRQERRALSNRYEEYPFSKEEIIASAQVACSYFGIKKDLIYAQDINENLIPSFQKELHDL